jgi:hypothetical protein
VTFKTGIYAYRDAFAGMAILAAVSIGFMQYIPNQSRTVAAMRVMAGAAVVRLGREIFMPLPHRTA